MNLCSDNHEEICHENRNCPLCEAYDQISKLQKEIENLRDEIKEMNDRDI